MSESTTGLHKTNGHVGTSSVDLVRRFLELLQDGEIDKATDLLSEDVDYMNVSLPTIRGRDRVRRVLSRAFGLPGAGFEVYIHKASVDGDSVLTERTDVLIYGPVRIQIWVWGRFDVSDGEIVMWKDYFDWLNFAVAAVRGLLGAVVPALRPQPPSAL
jgi:limonene-1,2-epoxide hydrolase